MHFVKAELERTNIQFDLSDNWWWQCAGEKCGEHACGKVVNRAATLDVKSMVGPNDSGGWGGKVLKLAKYAEAHCSPVDNGASGGMVDGNGMERHKSMVWHGIVWYGIVAM